jgi:hypothetical protein
MNTEFSLVEPSDVDLKVAKLLYITKKPISAFDLSQRDMSLILTELSIVMGVSSLELSNFLADTLSDGTTIV